MNIYLAQSLLLCHLKQSVKMCNMTVHTTIGKKSPQMQVRIIFLTIIHGCKQCLILKKVTVFDCLGNSGQILVNNAAGTDIHMSNLRVTHLSVWKSYCQAGSLSFYKRTFLH